ncbi:MAG: class IV adenylate cyclase [Rhodothermales bacterium]|jgi:predicted adenylyl cyclase CyaB
MPLNIEFKARCPEPDRIRAVLREMEVQPAVTDHQTDTYFHVPSGRLKLRSGNVERNLIFYRREDAAAPKRSDVWLAPCPEPEQLLELLTVALGVRCVVKKRREIYFHDNAKIHVDDIADLGSFVEVEVIAENNTADQAGMRASCREWMRRFGVQDEDLITSSYSDMIASI